MGCRWNLGHSACREFLADAIDCYNGKSYHDRRQGRLDKFLAVHDQSHEVIFRNKVANLVDDPFLTLLTGELAKAGSWSILGCTMMNCNTLGEDYPVEQITCLLGFSELAGFCEAFKKWLGVVPRQYRESSYATAVRVVS